VDEARDSVDRHVERWQPVLPDLDPWVEGAVTRMAFLLKHLKRVRQATLAAHGLQPYEQETLHALAGRGAPYRAGPSELAVELKMSPAAMTGRLDALEQRGYLRRTPSPTDRRKVVVELTPAGYDAWHAALAELGSEEHRLMGALTRTEQKQLSDLLRRMLLRAENG
jgi:DNA-binding MarR family transcriptional regulator